MSYTPRTDEEVEIAKKFPMTEHGLWVSAEFCRQLERELEEAKRKRIIEMAGSCVSEGCREIAARRKGVRTVGGRAVELLALVVGVWDEEQSKRTQSIADEPWHIQQARKLLSTKPLPPSAASGSGPNKEQP